MHVVIIGAGSLGGLLAKSLVTSGHEIAVIESKRDKCVEIEEVLGSVTVLGDGTDAVTLISAGINRADLVVTTTSKDHVNLVVCRLAKNKFDVPRTISLVNRHENIELFNAAGVDTSVDVTDLLLGRIDQGISANQLVHIMSLPGLDSRSLVNFRIATTGSDSHTRLGDFPVPDSTLIVLVISRDGSVVIPDEDTLISSGDQLIAVTTLEDEQDLGTLLGEVEGD